MRPYNVRESLTQSVFSFLYEDAPDIEYNATPKFKMMKGAKEQIKKRRPREDEIHVVYFPQTWGSTALGHGGVGGAAMSTAYTTVISFNGGCYVYFGGRFSYACKDTDEFRTMVANQRVPSKGSNKYDKLKTK